MRLLLICALILTVSLVGAPGAMAQVFPGTGVGPITDGNTGTPPQCGAPLTISFAVLGATGHLMTVGVDVGLTHTWVGDVQMTLRAPSGLPVLPLASNIGVQTVGSFGDSSNYGGTYRFSDGATGTNIWTAAVAAACGTDCVVPAGTYRTIAPGGVGQTNPPPVTSLHNTFTVLNATDTNGLWTLEIRDCAAADVGAVTTANLYIPDPTTDLIFVDSFQVSS